MTPRVLHVLESMTTGGIETTFLNVLRAFGTLEGPEKRRAVHDVLAFTSGPLEHEFRQTANALFIAFSHDELQKVVNCGYDVVHLLVERCAHRLAPLLLARGDSAVVYNKGYDLASRYRMEGGFYWPADDTLLSACDAVTFTTPDLASHYRVPHGRATVLGKAVDFAVFAEVPVVTDETPDRILCIANLHSHKRVADLIPALQVIRKSFPRSEVRIVGGGNQHQVEHLRNVAAQFGVHDAFTVAGPSSDIPGELASCRVVALPSASEGVPTALLEAMAAGRPVVATRVGHVESIITDGTEGFLVAAGDISTLADRISLLLGNRRLAARLGERGKMRAASHDVARVAPRLLNVLISAADERPEVSK